MPRRPRAASSIRSVSVPIALPRLRSVCIVSSTAAFERNHMSSEARALARGTRWEAILAPPTATGAAAASGRGDMPANLRWLREQGAGHVARWVAVKDGVLVASAETHTGLLDAIREHEDQASLLITRVERGDEVQA